MIQMISASEFSLTNGGHTMTLRHNNDAWWMTTHNACTKAWRGRMGSLRRFDTLAEVEQHYKSWRGVSLLVGVAA